MAIGRIAIVNRGEPAMRLINAVGELRADGAELTTIALFTEPDRTAMFVRQADESYPLGPALYTDGDGNRKVAYLDYPTLERALIETDADAVWVGWGFVAEHAEFADLCERLGVAFIGPGPDVMRRLGDKITSKQIAEAAGVPVAPWSGDAVVSLDDALAHAQRLGFPVMLKATAGGGGRGIRRVDVPDELPGAFKSARSEALGAFGDDALFVESMVTGARHIEVQIIGDRAGNVWPVGVRDCTVQRRNQKIIEEAPSPVLSREQDAFIKDAAARLGEAAGYVGAGTVEFLYDEATQSFYFMEVNARLQVEHPITEVTTGVDMVKLQLHVADGGHLEGEPPQTIGHAMEARINAEDPDRGFAPCPGRIDLLRMPSGPGTRVDTGVEDGDTVASEFDSMIAKVIAFGTDRTEAIARLDRALGQMRVVIRDGTTNKGFVRELLDHEDFHANQIDVGWVDRLARTTSLDDDTAATALVAAAITAYREQHGIELEAFKAAAARGRPEVEDGFGQEVQLRHGGHRYELTVGQVGPEAFEITHEDGTVQARAEQLDPFTMRLSCAGRSRQVLSVVHGGVHSVEVSGTTFRIAPDEGGVIRAPSPAVVVSLLVEPGQRVEKGDRLTVIEAMKMETSISAEFSGTVRQIDVHENTQVGAGTPLMIIDLTEDDEETPLSGRIDLTSLSTPHPGPHGGCRHYLDDLRRSLLGWDVTADRLAGYGMSQGPRCPDIVEEAVIRDLEDETLSAFVDIISLFRREPDEDGDRRSSEEYLFVYLRDVRAREGLPTDFLAQLQKTLAHYGVQTLDPSPRLDAALHRIVKAQMRMRTHVGPLLRVLEDRLRHVSDDGGADLGRLLDRIIGETRGRYPSVNDIARDVNYQTFDLPFLETVREDAYADAATRLGHLDLNPDSDERDDHIQALVDCPQPLKSALSQRYLDASPRHRQDMLEIMTRRYYRIRELGPFTAGTIDGISFAASRYRHEEREITVVSAHLEFGQIEEAADVVVRTLDRLQDTDDIVLDFYIWRADENGDTEKTQRRLQSILSARLGGLSLRRIVVAISAPGSGYGISGVVHFTFRPDGKGGYREESLYRDMHPMMAKRLELWRLENFDTRRLPSPEDIYLFHATAKGNRRDERIFGIGEVRDLTPVLDEHGRVARLPEFERVFHELIGAVRRFQSRRPPDRRLPWNQVIMYLWPELTLKKSDIDRIIGRLAPETEGIGLDRISMRVRVRNAKGNLKLRMLEVSNPSGRDLIVSQRKLPKHAIRTLDEYQAKVARLRQRGLIHPHELMAMLAPKVEIGAFPQGGFDEFDLEDDRLVPVERPPGANTANVVVGVVTNKTDKHPEGMTRMVIAGDPSSSMGSLAEPECRRIIAALDLAEERQIPVEWFAVSAGALISMESGTENMDWIALVLRRLVEFTQAGGEVNVVVTGINVGAQPYWNAEATMLMHTKGILVMTPDSAMVLTGKQALDYSGGVSAEDNQGIGGYERIMGPNGQAQFFARNVVDACGILLAHYDHSYVVPGERFPRSRLTSDPEDRDVRLSPHRGDFTTVGDVFAEATNPGRKHPFEIRDVMAAVIDGDCEPLERWYGMQDAELAVIWDAHLGGQPVCLIGFESKQLPRLGGVPADGPTQWTAGTLFPQSSKKVARAINAASANRPLVLVANLSGFDGSPESLRKLQLEYGAEIGRAVVNFEGPIVFCVVSRYHGGAFVVFSKALHDNMEVAAVAGSKASVIGGAPAAAVVFAREVARQTEADPRVIDVVTEMRSATGTKRTALADRLTQVRDQVRAEKRGEIADRFDSIHDIERARRVGSVDRIIEAGELRPYLIEAVRQGMRRELDHLAERS